MDHIIYDILCLTSFTKHNYFGCHYIIMSVFCSFFIVELYSIIWVNHIVLIHSSADGHLSCFHFGTIMKNAAICIHRQVSVDTPVHFSWVDTWSEISRLHGKFGSESCSVMSNFL